MATVTADRQEEARLRNDLVNLATPPTPPAENTALPLLREGFAIASSYQRSVQKEQELMAAISERHGVWAASALFDHYVGRVRAPDPTDPSAPSDAQETMILQRTQEYLRSLQDCRDAVYFATAADHGHCGRTYLELLRNGESNIKARFGNRLADFGFAQKMLGKERAKPVCAPNALVFVHVLNWKVSATAPEYHPHLVVPYQGEQRLDELRALLASHENCPEEWVTIFMANRNLHGPWSVAEWSLRPGTVLFYDIRNPSKKK